MTAFGFSGLAMGFGLVVDFCTPFFSVQNVLKCQLGSFRILFQRQGSMR